MASRPPVADSTSRVQDAIDRLTDIQTSIRGLNQEAMRVRNHIRDFDVNMDALNLLVNVRAKEPKDGGRKTLEALVQYARQVGSLPSEEAPPVPRALQSPASFSTVTPTTPSDAPPSGSLLKLASQLTIAMGVTWVLFSLLR